MSTGYGNDLHSAGIDARRPELIVKMMPGEALGDAVASPAAESGRLCHGDGAHKGGCRRRRALILTAEVVPKLCPTQAHS